MAELKAFNTSEWYGDLKGLVSRDGREVISLAQFPSAAPSRKIVAQLRGSVMPNFYHINGKMVSNRNSDEDLFFKIKTKKVYVGVYNFYCTYPKKIQPTAMTNGTRTDVEAVENHSYFRGWLTGPKQIEIEV